MKKGFVFVLIVLGFSSPTWSDTKKKVAPKSTDELSNRLKTIEDTLKNVEQKSGADETRLKAIEETDEDLDGEIEELGVRLKKIEDSFSDLNKKLDVLGERANMLAARTMGNYKGATYVRLGMTVLFPRASTFNLKTDTGLGVFAGVGKYFEEQHLGEAGINWDFYPALTVRYRFEWRNKSNTLNLGPILGVQLKLLNRDPLDKYLDPAEELKSIYGVIGIAAGHPIGLSLLQTELLAYFNQQFVIVGSVGLHYVL